jgi:hypothetical protein
MKQFKHIVITASVDDEEEVLITAGDDGYELVTVITLVNGRNKYYFKKRHELEKANRRRDKLI